jgi:uncharacterized membrane protein YgdD (TMEM256/DUF423 family)
MYRNALISGCVLALLAVMFGAFGAHALKTTLDDNYLKVFETGVRYQFYHAVALILTGILYKEYPQKQLKTAASLFIIGTLLFSGSLYAISLLSARGLSIGAAGVLTPIGGLLFLMGWLQLMVGVLKRA